MRRDEAGFTLVELLVAITILAAITGALGTAVIVAFRNLDSTHTRFAESHDAQMAAAYLVTDIQSASSVTTTQPTCASGGGTVATFSWTDRGTAHVVSYVVETASGERRLRRRALADGSATDVVVAHHLTTCTAATGPDPAVSVTEDCVPPAACPSRVTVALTDASGYRFTLTGERRVR